MLSGIANSGRCRAPISVLGPILGVVLVCQLPLAAFGEDREISARRAKQQQTFTDAEIASGFFKIAFGAELHQGGRTDRIRKYDGPVRVYVDNRAKPDRRDEVAAIIEDIRARVDNLDIAITESRGDANFVVTLVRDRDLSRTIEKLYGRSRARRIVASLEPQCLSGFRKDAAFRIVRSDVILAVDVREFLFRDCAYEEILQALGPINDDDSVPWTMFNDDVHMGFFDLYDQYLMNILYDPRIRPGMTRAEVRAMLPDVLSTVRDWVARVNKPDRRGSAILPQSCLAAGRAGGTAACAMAFHK